MAGGREQETRHIDQPEADHNGHSCQRGLGSEEHPHNESEEPGEGAEQSERAGDQEGRSGDHERQGHDHDRGVENDSPVEPLEGRALDVQGVGDVATPGQGSGVVERCHQIVEHLAVLGGVLCNHFGRDAVLHKRLEQVLEGSGVLTDEVPDGFLDPEGVPGERCFGLVFVDVFVDPEEPQHVRLESAPGSAQD